MICLMIMSCARDQTNGVNDACRRTFLREWPVLPHRFVIGAPAVEDDELSVDVPDDYGALQLKQRAAYTWALTLDREVTHVFLSFTDTYIHIPRLVHSGYEKHDYMGLQCKHGSAWLSGGNGYFLSRRAMQVILAAPPREYEQGDEAEWTIVTGAGIRTIDDHRFGASITRHLSKNTGNYDPQWMYDTHTEFTQ